MIASRANGLLKSSRLRYGGLDYTPAAALPKGRPSETPGCLPFVPGIVVNSRVNEARAGVEEGRSMNIEELNKRYKPLTPTERVAQLYSDFSKVLLTSSFGTTSVVLLHIFSRVRPQQVVHFLDTTYHFSETLEYKEKLKLLLGLNIRELKPDEYRNKFTASDNTWSKDPDLCCSVNKVEPLENIKHDHEVWVSGLMASQNDHRKQLDVFEDKGDIIKFYPLIDIDDNEAASYMQAHGLPEHPLRLQGYSSIGCVHCTMKGLGREGRWVNKSKTECGLHL